MNYDSYSQKSLKFILIRRDEELAEVKSSIEYKTYKKMADALHQERQLRLSYQESTEMLLKELNRYRKLVGDKPTPIP